MKPIIDISYYQQPSRINYDILAEQVKAVIIRAAYGVWKDTAFERHYAELTARGVPLGAYGFIVEYRSAAEQVNMFYDAVNGKQFQLGFWGDVELERGATPLTRETVLQFFAELDQKTGRQTNVYTGNWCWLDIMRTPALTDRKLWVADYVHTTAPSLPAGFTDWWLWQYTSSGRLSGYPNNLDMSYFNGDDDKFARWINGEEEPVTPPAPATPLFKAKCVAYALNVRKGPSVNYPSTGRYLTKDEVVNVYEVQNNWYRIEPDQQAWVSGYPDYMQIIEEPPIEPPVQPEPPEPSLEEKVRILWNAHPELW